MLGVLFSSSVCAYSFSRIQWKGRDKVFGFILTGLMIPFFVVMIPQYVFWNALHLTDTFVPLIAPAWFGGGVFNIFLLRQFFLSIPAELDEAAKVDGAGHFRIYLQIILPIGKQAMIVVGLLTFLANWNDYLGPLAFITSDIVVPVVASAAGHPGGVEVLLLPVHQHRAGVLGPDDVHRGPAGHRRAS